MSDKPIDWATTFMGIGLGGSFASGVLGAYSSIQQGRQEKLNAEANARAMEIEANEELANQQIESANDAEQTTRRLEAMRARYAKSGLAMSGTPEAFLVEQAETSAVQTLAKDRASQIRRRNLLTSAENMRTQGESAKTGSYWNAGTGILGSLSGAASIGASYGLNVGKKNPAGGVV